MAIRHAWGTVLLIADGGGQPLTREGIKDVAMILETIEDTGDDMPIPEPNILRSHRAGRHLRAALAMVPEDEPNMMQAVLDVLVRSL